MIEKKTILIVEDSKADRHLIEKSLNETLGDCINKFWSSSIQESRQILLNQKVDLIILDLMLQDSQGFDSIVKLHQFAGETPTIIFTCSEDETLRYKSLSTGIRGYLKKDNAESYIELAELIIGIFQQDYFRSCRLSLDCPQNINSIKLSISDLISSVDDLKLQVQNLNGKIIGNGTIGYGSRIEKLECFRNTIIKYWWILFPIVATAILGSFFV